METLATIFTTILVFFGVQQPIEENIVPEDNFGSYAYPTAAQMASTSGASVGDSLTYAANGLLEYTTVSGSGDNISIDGSAVTDPDFVSTGDIDFVDTSNTVTANINADTIVEADLNVTNAPTDNYVLKYNQAGGNFTWAADQTGAGGGGGGIGTTTPFTAGDIVEVVDNGTVKSTSTISASKIEDAFVFNTGDTINGDLTVTGTSTFATTTLDADVTFSPRYSTQSYLLTSCQASGNCLAWQGQNSGTDSLHRLFAKDGDGTDNVYYATYGVGTPTDLTNRERLLYGYSAANTDFEIFTEANGTGTLRPLSIYTEGNTNQLYLNTDGNIGIGTTSPAQTLDIWGNLRVGTSSDPVLYVDSAASLVSIGATDTMTVNGTSIPTKLQIHGENGNTTSELELHKHSDTAGGAAIFYGARTRGTEGAETVVQDGDSLFRIAATGYDGTDYALAGALDFIVDGTPGADDMPTAFTIGTSPDGGQSATERLRVDNAGNVGIGTTTPANTLDVNGSVRFEDLGGGLLTTAANGLLSVDTSSYLTTVDISDDTNLTVGATGIELVDDDIALTAGYNIPLTASTTNWNNFYDTPSSRITAGTNISWSTNTLNVDTDLANYSNATSLFLDGVTATGLEKSGTDVALTAGYTIPLTASTTEWATAYGWGDHSAAGYATSLDTAYNGGNTIDVDGDPVTMTVSNTDNNAALVLNQNDTTNNPNVFEINNSGTGAELVIENTNAGADGAYIEMYHNTASPAANDVPGLFSIYGKDSDANKVKYGEIKVTVNNSAVSSEDATMDFTTAEIGGRFNKLSIQPRINGVVIGDIFFGAAELQSEGNNDLILQTGNATTSSITITDGANGNITLAPDGTGIVDISSLGNVGTIDATTESTIESAIDTLANLTSASSLATVGTITSGTWNAAIQDGLIVEPDLSADNAPADGDYLQYDSTGTNFVWRSITELWGELKSTVEAASMTLTGAWDFGGATSLEIPNGTNPTTDATGELALDTTDNQLIIDDGTNDGVIRTEERIFGFTLASTSPEFVSGGEIPVPLEKDGYTVTNIKCYVQGGTSVQMTLTDNTNAMDTLTCATTATTDDGTIANNTVTADELMYVDVGTITGTPDYVTFSVFGRWTRE